MTEAQSGSFAAPLGPARDHPEAVGRYRIIRRLGEGGMGSVFLAQDTILRREVALKLPLSGTENDPEVRERFLREARSAATLDHPYICQVYDADEVDGRLYLAMAYIEGQSLADLVRAEGMPPRQVVALVGKLAIALQEAHTHGVVHRDLKPRNIMIRTVGSKREPVIVDFGLVRLEGPEDARMTRTGQVMGTPAYMAPEQLRGKPDEIGPPCDIYALGVILYELLTGRLPFVGPYPVLVAQILTQPPLPPSAHSPSLDKALDAICFKAMAKDVSERYASMMELATALTGYLRDTPSASILGRPIAPISRPIEGDSIPTGADTLVSQFLGRDEIRPLIPGIDLPPSQIGRTTKNTPSPVPAEKGGSSPLTLMRRKSQWAVIIASAILGLFLLAGIIIVVTNNGQVTIDAQDTSFVRIDGQEIRLAIDGDPIVLRAGEHSVDVKWKDGHFETKKFQVKRGETTPLSVTYQPNARSTGMAVKKAASPSVASDSRPAPDLDAKPNQPKLSPSDPSSPENVRRRLESEGPSPNPSIPASDRIDAEVFNGRNLDGWVGIHVTSPVDPGRIFRVENGELRYNEITGTIRLKTAHSNFSFKFEYFIPKGRNDDRTASNAALCIKFPNDEPYQVEDANDGVSRAIFSLRNHRDFQNSEPVTAGALQLIKGVKGQPQPFVSGTNEATSPPDRWNEVEVRCQGRVARFFLNGREANHATFDREIVVNPEIHSFHTNIRIRNIRLSKLR